MEEFFKSLKNNPILSKFLYKTSDIIKPLSNNISYSIFFSTIIFFSTTLIGMIIIKIMNIILFILFNFFFYFVFNIFFNFYESGKKSFLSEMFVSFLIFGSVISFFFNFYLGLIIIILFFLSMFPIYILLLTKNEI